MVNAKRGNRTQATESLPFPATTDDPIVGSSSAVILTNGTWTNVSGFKESTQVTASLQLGFIGSDATVTMGKGPDHGLYDIYLSGSLWQTFDGYAAAASEQAIVIPTLATEGLHVFEVRVRSDKNAASTGNKVRFKQVQIMNMTQSLWTIRYRYDALARVRDAKHYPGLNVNALDTQLVRRYQFAYDLSGSRTQEIETVSGTATTTNYGYNAANQMTSAGAAALTYDDNGNLTNDGTNTYTWDRANRLLSVGGVSYAYDGLGNRIKRTVGSTVTQYLLDLQPGLSVTLSETTGANTTRYLHTQRGIHVQEDSAGNWEWMAEDGLGSVRSVIDWTGAVLWRAHYDPYGTAFSAVGSVQTNYGFTGEQYDSTNDMLYLRARHYKPGVGVFTALDPFEGMAQRPMSLNGYSWVEGNVTNLIDPQGLYCQGSLSDGLGLLSCGLSNLQQLISDVATVTRAAADNFPDAWNETWNETWQCGLDSFVQSHIRAANSFGTWYREVGNRQIADAFFPVTAGGFVVQDWLNGSSFETRDTLLVLPFGIFMINRGGVVRTLRSINNSSRRWISDGGIAFNPDRNIRIVGFQGSPRFQNEPSLIQIGHVGISLDGGQTVFGFRPSQETVRLIETATGRNFLDVLLEGYLVPGQVYNDTAIFRRANELVTPIRSRTAVYQLIIPVSGNEFSNIQRQLLSQIENGVRPPWYRLPNVGELMPSYCNNCATWPRTLGINIPEQSGVLEDYMAILRNNNLRWP